ncbi:hypothetical protein [Kitasatospora sp. NBC_01266]|uniref:hypothetical protein n=1 Tax=Kitasatospora sp. NBC_01266 TaxID=2903572 RepID=UPI002E381C46|nr:hypothetical protein [Kitasatospora sp. NBC_01266]
MTTTTARRSRTGPPDLAGDTPTDLSATTVGVEHETKWQISPDLPDGPQSFFDSGPLRSLTPVRRPLEFVQSAIYLDDERHALTRAGHSLSVVVNSGPASGVCWLTFKQSVQWRGWRDGLELGERLTPAEVPAAMNDSGRLPIGHARRCGLTSGPLRPVGSATQHRHKRLGRTPEGVEVAYSLDRVTFRDLDAASTPVSDYTCVEIEVNSSAPAALWALARLAQDIDDWLGLPRDRMTKAQRAIAALDRQERAA